MTISKAASVLENCYEVLNKKYFESALPKVIITIQSSPTAYGHFTTWESWKCKDNGFHEINIGAENLNRPMAQTITTLIHEMVHLYCYVNGIKDTSRNGIYHNKKFKEEAEKRGIMITYDKTIGHSISEPTKELKSFVAKQHWNGKLNIVRDYYFGEDGTEKPKKKTSTRKYICPICGTSVRATKDVNIICGDCNEQMEKEN